jgi:pimeloyl-ACP methyl ester carboxylesterase
MEFHHRSYGAGPPLIVLHGLLGSLDNWSTLARRWGKYFHVLTFDARNHGRSFHHGVMDYPSMAEDLLQFMTQHGIESAHLLGHSMGGKTAMHFALTHPSRVERLVVVDIAPRTYERKHDRILDALVSFDPGRFTARGEADEALAHTIPEDAIRQFLLKNLIRREDGGFRWKMNLEAITRSYDALREGVGAGGRFDGPTLFVRGDRSPYVEESDLPRILELFPRAVITTVAHAGHWVHADAPDDLFRVVLPFLLEP